MFNDIYEPYRNASAIYIHEADEFYDIIFKDDYPYTRIDGVEHLCLYDSGNTMVFYQHEITICKILWSNYADI